VNFLKNGKPTQRPEGVYSTDLFTDEMINSIKKFDGDGKSLFMYFYLPFQLSHIPLQVPQQYIQKYMGKYDMGCDQIRRQRFEKQKELGIWPADIIVFPVKLLSQSKL
jgi:arylsulfatase A-like enzyme